MDKYPHVGNSSENVRFEHSKFGHFKMSLRNVKETHQDEDHFSFLGLSAGSGISTRTEAFFSEPSHFADGSGTLRTEFCVF